MNEQPPEQPAPAPAPFFARFADLGAATQAAVPGLYAWTVTVVPPAFAHGASTLAKPFAFLAFVILVGAAIAERSRPREARLVSVWGFTMTCAVSWALSSPALAPTRLEALRGVTGMIAWGLFAYASAAPSRGAREKAPAEVRDGAPLVPRTKLARGDALYLAFGSTVAVVLELVGWRTASQERALLVRMVLLVAGIGVLGASMSAALARHSRPRAASARHRVRPLVIWVGVVVFTWFAGVAAWAALTQRG